MSAERIEHVDVARIKAGDEVRLGGLGWYRISFAHITGTDEVCLSVAGERGDHRFRFKRADQIERRAAP